MTAWQDQPPLSRKPLSRRQVREGERGDLADASVDLARASFPQPPVPSSGHEGWDTEARRIAAASIPAPHQQEPASRRSQRSLQAVDPFSDPGAEPLEYLTQARPQAQSPDGQQFRRRSVSAVDPQQQGYGQQQNYRLRDFSPEARPIFSSTVPETVQPTVPENLQYRTQGTPPPMAQPVMYPPVEERTLSRRELRAMEAAQQVAQPFPQQADPFAQLMSPPPLVEPTLAEQPRMRDRTRQAATDQGYSAVNPVAINPVADFAAPSPEPSTWTPPTGHWSMQALIDDDEQIQENTLSRNVGVPSGAITTSALVLPTLPSDNLTRPLGSTGEILITGTIDLPRSLGATGAHPGRFDHSDVDAYLEAGDREDTHANPGSEPVRAIRAVSTHTSTRGVMEAKKPKGASRLPVILGVAATVMLVGVIVLVVAATVFGVFK
jgi:hypothetical protein